MSNALRAIKKNIAPTQPASYSVRAAAPFKLTDRNGTFQVNAGDTLTLTASGYLAVERQAVKPEPPVEERSCPCSTSDGKICGSKDRLSNGIYVEMMLMPENCTDVRQARHTGEFNWLHFCFEHQLAQPDMSDSELFEKIALDKTVEHCPPYDIEANQRRAGNAFIKDAAGRQRLAFDLPIDRARNIVLSLNFALTGGGATEFSVEPQGEAIEVHNG